MALCWASTHSFLAVVPMLRGRIVMQFAAQTSWLDSAPRLRSPPCHLHVALLSLVTLHVVESSGIGLIKLLQLSSSALSSS